ncbi:MAG: hypothetical protein AAF594_11890 [Bacteroidota bacterium]
MAQAGQHHGARLEGGPHAQPRRLDRPVERHHEADRLGLRRDGPEEGDEQECDAARAKSGPFAPIWVSVHTP